MFTKPGIDPVARWFALLLALALTSFALPAKAQSVVTASRPTNVSVTVYRDPNRDEGGEIDLGYLSGFAVITETRTVTLPAGASTIRFEGVSGGMVAVSAVVTGLPGGVVQKNRDAKLLSPASLLDGTLGNLVTIRRTDPITGRVIEQQATIRTGSGGAVVFQTSQGLEALRCSGLPETLVYSELPDGLTSEPVLSVDTVSPGPATATVTLTYITAGFDWAANYVATVSKDGRKLDLFAWITVANSNAETFPNAQLLAVAGTLNKEEDEEVEDYAPSPELRLRCYPLDSTSTAPRWGINPQASPPAPGYYSEDSGGEEIIVTGSRITRKSMDSASPISVVSTAEQENLGDLKLYRVPFRTTVAANGQKQVALLIQKDVPFKRLYVAYVSPTSDEEDEPLAIELSFENRKKDNMGVPLPSGGIAIFQRYQNEDLLLADNSLGDYAVDQKVKISAGDTQQVLYSYAELEDKNPNDALTPMRATLTNANGFAVDVELRIYDDDSIKLEGNGARKLKRKDGLWVWAVRVPAGGTKTLDLIVREIEDE